MTKFKTLLDGDKLRSVNLRKVGNAAVSVVDQLQSLTREEQVVGAAAVFICLCRAFRVSGPDTFQIADRVIETALKQREFPEIKALQEYIKGELL